MMYYMSQLQVFQTILEKKRGKSFVLHTDWKYSCLPKPYLLISETFASVIWTNLKGKFFAWSLHYNLNFITRSTHLDKEHQTKS